MTLDRLKQLREDIEGACDLSLSERLREQHRTAAIETAALMEAFVPVIAVKEEVVLRIGERWDFRIQDPDGNVEFFGVAVVARMRGEYDEPPITPGYPAQPKGFVFPPPFRAELCLVFPCMTIRRI